MTATEMDLWDFCYKEATKSNIKLGKFDMRVVEFSWPWLFACQREAVRCADLAITEHRAMRLLWPPR